MDSVMRGDAALAHGALAAGVRVVTGYPGSPATGVWDAILARTAPDAVDVTWAPNEKVAMELAIGASLGGARALVVLKSVGLNVALDPLATMSYTGCHRGLVILLGEDPGAWGSQNEQDSRWAARLAEVPVVEPTGVGQAAAVMAQAFAWSESIGTPVIVRIVGALAAASGSVDEPWTLPKARGGFRRQRNRWITLPPIAIRRHRSLHARLRRFRAAVEASPYDVAEGRGGLGVLAVGYTRSKLQGILERLDAEVRVLGLCSTWPLPEERLAAWMAGLRRVLVLEEGGPFVEEALAALSHSRGLDVEVLGRHCRAVPEVGELAERDLAAALGRLDAGLAVGVPKAAARDRVAEVPLCEGCPYRPAFEALLGAMESAGGRRRHIVVGETGCMVRANLPPMELFDVKYSLGSGLGLGLGLAAADGRHRVVALLGDSSFFHSDLNALPYAVRRDAPLVAVVLDNATTALTGGQVHPGSRLDERGRRRDAIDLAGVARGLGAQPVVLSADDPPAMAAGFRDALLADGFRFLIVRGDCPRHLPRTTD